MAKCMRENKRPMMPIVLNMSPDEVQNQTGSYAISFSQHKRRYIPEAVQEWRDALKEVVKLKCFELKSGRWVSFCCVNKEARVSLLLVVMLITVSNCLRN